MGIKRSQIKGFGPEVGVSTGDRVTSHYGYGSGAVWEVVSVDGPVLHCKSIKTGKTKTDRVEYVDVLLPDAEVPVNELDRLRGELERVRALVRLLYPDELTPTGKRQFDAILGEGTK